MPSNSCLVNSVENILWKSEKRIKSLKSQTSEEVAEDNFVFNIGKAGNRRRATQVLYHEVLAQQNTSCSYHHTLVLLNIDRDSHSVSRPSKIDSSIRNNPPICDLPVYIARNYIYFTSIQCNHSRIVPHLLHWFLRNIWTQPDHLDLQLQQEVDLDPSGRYFHLPVTWSPYKKLALFSTSSKRVSHCTLRSLVTKTLFNRPGVAGAVLHTASLLIN